MSSRILVAYYTRSGHTQKLASSIAEALDADLEQITDRVERSGILGYVRSAAEAYLQRKIELGPLLRDPTTYDLVVVGTPVWSMSVASPVRSYLDRYRDRLRQVAFFCTCGGRGGERAFEQMARACNVRPTATLSLREAHLDRVEEIDRFTAQLEAAIARTAPTPTSTTPPIIPLGTPAK